MAQQEDVHKDGIVARNNALWKTAQYSDMTVRCGYEEFKVHRAIVCQGSQFFATACNGQYQVCVNQHSKDIADDDYRKHRQAS